MFESRDSTGCCCCCSGTAVRMLPCSGPRVCAYMPYNMWAWRATGRMHMKSAFLGRTYAQTANRHTRPHRSPAHVHTVEHTHIWHTLTGARINRFIIDRIKIIKSKGKRPLDGWLLPLTRCCWLVAVCVLRFNAPQKRKRVCVSVKSPRLWLLDVRRTRSTACLDDDD